MVQSTFEETRIGTKELGDKVKFLKEGMECNVLSWSDKVSFRALTDLSLASKHRPQFMGCSVGNSPHRNVWEPEIFCSHCSLAGARWCCPWQKLA